MKKITCLFLLLLLCACSNSEKSSITSSLDNIFDNLDNIDTYRINNSMAYYSYYLPSDMCEEENDSDSVVLKYLDSKIVMNLNVSAIVNSEYYNNNELRDDGFFNEEYKIYEKSGSYSSSANEEKNYIFKLYNDGKNYAIHFETSDMNYYGSVTFDNIKEVSRHLLMIDKSVEVDKESVASTYAKRDVIDYEKKQIDLFDSTMPSSGQLSEMLVDDAIVGNEGSETIATETENNDSNVAEESTNSEPNEEENSDANENQEDINE